MYILYLPIDKDKGGKKIKNYLSIYFIHPSAKLYTQSILVVLQKIKKNTKQMLNIKVAYKLTIELKIIQLYFLLNSKNHMPSKTLLIHALLTY